MNAPTPQGDPLAALRDIQLPEPIGWWPLAPGWWVLAFALLALLAWSSRKLWKTYRRKRVYRAQQQWLTDEVRQIELQAQQEPQIALNRLSQLVRRCALQMQANSFQEERSVAGLQGDEWLVWLQNHGGEMLTEHREWLLEAPYRANNPSPPAELFNDCRQFFKNAAPALNANTGAA